mgnify:CR=1 FL=1
MPAAGQSGGVSAGAVPGHRRAADAEQTCQAHRPPGLHRQSESELTERTRIRVIEAIDSMAYGLGMKALARINEKTKTASIPELLSIAGATIGIGKGDIGR